MPKKPNINLGIKDFEGRDIPTNIDIIPRKDKLIVFPYFGGKYSHINWLLPLLPECYHYCEPFGGSATVLLNRKPSPVETYNDISGDLVNFFRVLRDFPDELLKSLFLTPYAKEELFYSMYQKQDISNIERARLFFVEIRQSFGSKLGNGIGSWAISTDSARGMGKKVSAWMSSVNINLPNIVNRLKLVQIENSTYQDILKKYDSNLTLFYCDPPYIGYDEENNTYYSSGFSSGDMEKLVSLLKKCKSKIALSGYRSEFMDKLCSGFNMIEGEMKVSYTSYRTKREILWTNYNCDI